MTLHSEFRAYLDWLNPIVEENARAGMEATPESARAALAGLNEFALPAEQIARVFDSEVVDVPVRVYVPRPDTPSDTLLFVHGGGHMAGDLDVYDYSARRTAKATGMVVVSVDYRRSPEAKYPAGLEDVHAVQTHLGDVLNRIASTGRLHAMGDSGGGAKVASISQRVAAGQWQSTIERQVLLYPSLDYTMRGQTIRDYGAGYFLSSERIAWYFDHYFPENADRELASPLTGPFTPEMPDTLVIAAEYDPLLSEAELYVERMRGAGADSHLLVAPGMIHAFAFFETKIPSEIERLYTIIGDFLRAGNVPDQW